MIFVSLVHRAPASAIELVTLSRRTTDTHDVMEYAWISGILRNLYEATGRRLTAWMDPEMPILPVDDRYDIERFWTSFTTGWHVGKDVVVYQSKHDPKLPKPESPRYKQEALAMLFYLRYVCANRSQIEEGNCSYIPIMTPNNEIRIYVRKDVFFQYLAYLKQKG